MQKSIRSVYEAAKLTLAENPDMAADLSVADVCHLIATGCRTGRSAPVDEEFDDLHDQALRMERPFTARDLVIAALGNTAPDRRLVLLAGRAARSALSVEPRKGAKGVRLFHPPLAT